MVGSVALYGTEIWGWKNKARLDRIKRKYIKWILGLDRTTPNYILVEETKIKETRTESIKRAIKYEEKAWNSANKIVIECIKDLDKKGTAGEESKWKATRGGLLKGLGIEKEEVRKERETENKLTKMMLERSERREKEERRKKIADTRCYRIYKDLTTENMPEYLKEKMKRNDRCLIGIEMVCGNECRGNQHWKEEED